MDGFDVAIVDATDIVGQEIVKVLEQRKFPVASIQLLVPEHSSGVKLLFNHQRIEVRKAKPEAFQMLILPFSLLVLTLVEG